MYEAYQSLTENEKAAITDLPVIQDIRICSMLLAEYTNCSHSPGQNVCFRERDSAFRADMKSLLSPSVQYDINEAYERFLKYYIGAK